MVGSRLQEEKNLVGLPSNGRGFLIRVTEVDVIVDVFLPLDLGLLQRVNVTNLH